MLPDRGQTWACWGQLDTMLAHFSLLGAFFSLLAASCAFVERFLVMLVIFFRVCGRSKSDFGRVWTLTTSGLEVQTPYFSMVFVDNA